jgi:hypothetical protein
MELLNAALRKVEAIDKNASYNELVEEIQTDKELAASIHALSQLVNRNSAKFDQKYLQSLNVEELLALIRTLTLLDGKIRELSLGSAAPVTTLIRELESRNYKYYESIVDWVFKNRTNPYVPFGALFGGEAKSLKEYQILTLEKQLRLQQTELDAEFIKLEKLKKEYPKATADLRNAIRRNDCMAFDGLVSKGAELYALDADGKTLAEKIEEMRNQGVN